jgi:ABC-type glycerol-3-phosphate transport system substrate-binding protein
LPQGFARLQATLASPGVKQAVDLAAIAAAANAGKAVLTVGPFALGEALEKHGPWLAALLPEATAGQPMQPWLEVTSVVVLKRSTNAAAAVRVAELLASDEVALLWYEMGRRLPATVKFYENARWASHPMVKVLRVAAERATPRPPAVEVQRLQMVLEDARNAAATPGILPDQAWQQADERRR